MKKVADRWERKRSSPIQNEFSLEPLSLARARSVKAYLVKNFSIDPKRIGTEGMGNSAPLVKEKTKAAALVNQRIDIETL